MNIKIKHIIIFCLLLCLSTNCNAQNSNKTTMIKKMNLKGKVQSVYAFNGDTFIKTYFNENGQLIKKETKYLLFNNYVYDKQERLISYDVRVLSDPNGYTDYYHLQYDKRGFLINDGYTTYVNDERGNCIEEMRNYLKPSIIKRKYNKKIKL